MAELLQNKVAVVTGGSSGNGRGICQRFAEEGADIVVADIRSEPREGGTPTHEKIRKGTDQRAKYVECDVSDIGDLQSAVDAADEFGGLTTMVNNAGINADESFLEMTMEEYNRLTDINVKGTFFGAQAAANKMIENDTQGSIVNMASVFGFTGGSNSPVYCSNKAAIVNLTYSLAGVLAAEDIRVNGLAPGTIRTQMSRDLGSVGTDVEEKLKDESIPRGRIGTPTDIGNAATFLASDQADFINAVVIPVDGGFLNVG